MSLRDRKYLPDFEHFVALPGIARWIAIAFVVGILSGTASAILLASLELATRLRESHVFLIALLPAAGFVVGWLYRRFGRSVEAGNNLLLEEIHDPQSVIPARMTPLVLLGTFVSHLFGASAGREGTALQTGASLADQLSRPLGLGPSDRRILLMAGISGGFASVFGTPLAGAVFGLEVLAIGKLRYDAILPCFIAAIVGERVTLAWGLHHTVYHIPYIPAINTAGLLLAALAGIIFGTVARVFANTTHQISAWFRRKVAYEPLRPVIGGVLVAAAMFAFGTTRYAGLGIPVIQEAFLRPLPPWDFAAKLMFTAVTLGSGFKGGEVTPLFFIGATLGNVLGYVLPLPAPLLAGMGFVAVFAGAANTPLASTLMAIELFGAEGGVFAAIACIVSYLSSGHAGIYQAQRIGLSKIAAADHEEGFRLADLHEIRRTPEIHLYEDLHELGFLKGTDDSRMNDLTVLRLYFRTGATARAQQGWRKLFAPALGPYLLQHAREAGIEQAILHRVFGGFLRDGKLTQDNSEIVPPNLPQCLELIGEEELLRAFLDLHRRVLGDVRIVLLRAEQIDPDPAAESRTVLD
ncbi:MAG TPA: voltage-gated chloride channel family protein [Bryobacteraceae bacterium]|nr:voltage-gated chloride channel family protein [Bryobacteraceae bacterium]